MAHSRRQIWIIDEPVNFELYAQLLAVQFELKSFETPEDASRSDGQPALVIADAPKTLESVRRLTASEAPVLLVSRNDAVDFMRGCLKVGASAYVLKPLRQSELFLTLEKLLGVELLPNTLEGEPIHNLTLKERQLLAVFLTRTGSLSRAELHDCLWRGVSVNRKTLDVHLFNLRRKLHPRGYGIVCEGLTYSLVRTAQVELNCRAQVTVG